MTSFRETRSRTPNIINFCSIRNYLHPYNNDISLAKYLNINILTVCGNPRGAARRGA